MIVDYVDNHYTDADISVKSLSYYNDPSLLTLSVMPEKN